MSMNSSGAPAKFSFDLDLGQARQRTRVVTEQALAEMLKDAEKKGYENGMRDGQNSAASRSATQISAAASALAGKTAQIMAASDQAQKQILVDATKLAVSVARKLAANLIARTPLGEIESLVEECLSSLENVPHLVIRCHPDLATALREMSESKMAASGFSGRLVVMGEPEISLGDVRIEWVDGGLVRDLSSLSEKIDQRVSAFIAVNGPAPTNPPIAETPSNE
ncbi:hypothetical protein MNBD_ALPHA12-1664 [hydrothermal vent metagenome]|uniref:Uncharacterized protein n=1 Tax=hydrothermal vent metagenome TaxID=652676 RepID=A0A3B0TS46_9ZZZZ